MSRVDRILFNPLCEVPMILSAHQALMSSKGGAVASIDALEPWLRPGVTVGVLGLFAAPAGPLRLATELDAAPGMQLAVALVRRGVNVIIYDAAMREAARSRLGRSAQYALDLPDAVQASDVLVVTAPCPTLQSLRPSELARPHRRRVVVDLCRWLAGETVQPYADYHSLPRRTAGRGGMFRSAV